MTYWLAYAPSNGGGEHVLGVAHAEHDGGVARMGPTQCGHDLVIRELLQLRPDLGRHATKSGLAQHRAFLIRDQLVSPYVVDHRRMIEAGVDHPHHGRAQRGQARSHRIHLPILPSTGTHCNATTLIG